jgi:hypothetical protein
MEEITYKEYERRKDFRNKLLATFFWGTPLMNALVGIYFIIKTIGRIFSTARNPLQELCKLTGLVALFFPLCYLGLGSIYMNGGVIVVVLMQIAGAFSFTYLVESFGFRQPVDSGVD